MVGLFEASRPELHRGHEPSLRELLARGAERIRSELGQRPEVRAALLEAMGEAYVSQSLYDDAAGLLESALDLRRGVLGRDHPEVAATALTLATAEQKSLTSTGPRRWREKRSPFSDPSPRTVTSAPPTPWPRSATCWWRKGAWRKPSAVLRDRLEPGSPSLGLPMTHLGDTLTRAGRADEAEPLLRSAVALVDSSLGADHYRAAMARVALARSLTALARYEEAERLLVTARARLEDHFGPDHRSVRYASRSLEELYVARDEPELPVRDSTSE